MRAINKVLLVMFLTMIFIAIRLPSLGQYVTADEPTYFRDSAAFLYATTHGEFGKTYRIVHPGVTTMWMGAAGYILKFPEFIDAGQTAISDFFMYHIFQKYGLTQMQVLVAGRFFSVLGHAGVYGLSCWYLISLIGIEKGFLGSLIISVSPFYFAHSRLLHPDGFLAITMILALLAYLSFIFSGKWIDLIISGIAFGLALLTKVPALVITPVIILVHLEAKYGEIKGKPVLKSIWDNLLKYWIIWGFVGILVFFSLFPAMWVAPLEVIRNLSAFFFQVTQGDENYISRMFFNRTVIMNGQIGLRYWYFYPLAYLWRAGIVELLGIIMLSFVWLFPGTRSSISKKEKTVTMALLCFTVIFVLFASVSVKKFDRYILPVFLSMALLSAVGWGLVFQYFINTLKGNQGWIKNGGFWGMTLLVGLIGALPLISTYPYFLSYYNPILGGGEKATEVMMVGWGEGLDQAARYLNELPQANNLEVYAFYANVLNMQFVGRADSIFLHELTPEEMETITSGDYLVLYRNHLQRQAAPALVSCISQYSPELIVEIGSIEYAYVYKVPDGFMCDPLQ